MAVVVVREKKALSLAMIMVVALLATSFIQIHASSEDLPAENGHEGSKGKACCDLCVCTLSIPPQCRCLDVKSYCHPSCKGCVCNWSHPPQCSCYDIKDHCDKKCKTTAAF